MNQTEHHGLREGDRVLHRAWPGRPLRIWQFATPGQFTEMPNPPDSRDPKDNCLVMSGGGTTVFWAWTGDLRREP